MRHRLQTKRKSQFAFGIATFSGLAAVALVISILVIGMRSTEKVFSPEVVAADSLPLEGAVFIEISDEETWISEQEGPKTGYSIEELQRLGVFLTNGSIGSLPVHIQISEDTRAGRIVETVEDLRQLGIRSYAVSVNPRQEDAEDTAVRQAPRNPIDDDKGQAGPQ